MRGERGSAALLVSALVGVVALVGVASASVGVLLSERERVVTAAEAAALAAAVATFPPASGESPRHVATAVARLNGAEIGSCSCVVDASPKPRRVTVRTWRLIEVPVFGRVKVVGGATAEFDPGAWLAADG